jgi:peptidoglycan hydrolase-like protein with peptidoglycan-binding domain
MVYAVAALLAAALAGGCDAAPPAGPGARPSADTVSPPATAAPTGAPSTTAPTAAPPTAAPTTAAPTTAAPTTSAAPSAPGGLRSGARGPEVLELQRRLVALGYWLGEPDGVYGAATLHAVTAFQKVTGLRRDGVAGPATRQALATAARPAPRSGTGRVAEVDLARQVLLVTEDGRVAWVFDASTGSRPGTTRKGHFTVYRQVNGDDPGPLGTLYRPKYFDRGVAVHGYPNVPAYPASHGCVRVSNAAMDWLWSSGTLPIGRPVWVY